MIIINIIVKPVNLNNMNYEVFDNSYCINVENGKYASLVQDHDEWYSPDKNEDGAIFEIVSDPYYDAVHIIGDEFKTCNFINVKSSLTGNVYRVLYRESKRYK